MRTQRQTKDDLYAVLGLERTASADEIRQAYRTLARKYHPDVNPGDAAAEANFKRVASAYEVLSDDARRKAYDDFGDDSLRSGFDAAQAKEYQRWQKARARGAQASGFAADDFDLDGLFGFGRAPRRARRGVDVQAVVEMTLREAIAGGDVRFEVPGRKAATVRIPPGADDGSLIRLKERGVPGSGAGAKPGDVIITVRVKPHPRVKRVGLNLIMPVKVSLDEAYNGASITVPTFTGPIKLTVPPLSQPGTKLRVRGKGVRRKDRVGDLLVELDVRLPDILNDELGAAISAARGSYREPITRAPEL